MDEVVLLAAIATIGVILVVVQLARLVRAGMQHRTIRDAIDRDHAAVPELLAAMETPRLRAWGSDRRIAFVLIALALAAILAVALQGNLNDLRDVAGVALFPLLVGGALLLHRHLYPRPDDAA